ncbi:MAG: cytidylate kinase [Bacteriovoracaceae bacterium]|jgi:cytidylate kinase
MKSKVIAIDGPSGSGKSTITKLIAEKLGLIYLDTGAMFRAIAFHLDENNILSSEITKIENELENMNFQYAKDESHLVEINGKNLTQKIREHQVSELASIYSKVPRVREYLKNLQRKIAGERPSILEGRDIGTVIFPDAALKFFLTADPKIRAERRLQQIKEKDPTTNLTVESIFEDIVERDKSDQQRAIAPLVKAEDAKEINTTSMTIEEVVSFVCSEYKNSQDLFN